MKQKNNPTTLENLKPEIKGKKPTALTVTKKLPIMLFTKLFKPNNYIDRTK